MLCFSLVQFSLHKQQIGFRVMHIVDLSPARIIPVVPLHKLPEQGYGSSVSIGLKSAKATALSFCIIHASHSCLKVCFAYHEICSAIGRY